jgi:hypothetical protein
VEHDVNVIFVLYEILRIVTVKVDWAHFVHSRGLARPSRRCLDKWRIAATTSVKAGCSSHFPGFHSVVTGDQSTHEPTGFTISIPSKKL